MYMYFLHIFASIYQDAYARILYTHAVVWPVQLIYCLYVYTGVIRGAQHELESNTNCLKSLAESEILNLEEIQFNHEFSGYFCIPKLRESLHSCI